MNRYRVDVVGGWAHADTEPEARGRALEADAFGTFRPVVDGALGEPVQAERRLNRELRDLIDSLYSAGAAA